MFNTFISVIRDQVQTLSQQHRWVPVFLQRLSLFNSPSVQWQWLGFHNDPAEAAIIVSPINHENVFIWHV